MKVRLIKTKQTGPSCVSEGSEVVGTLTAIVPKGLNEKDELVELTSLVQIEEGTQLLVQGQGLHNFIRTSPIKEILEVSELNVEFKTKTSTYIASLINVD